MTLHLSRSMALGTAMLVIAATVSPAFAAPPSNQTVVTTGEMCGGCVKRIHAKLDGYPGIAKVECDVKSQTITLTPAANTVLSPMKLWEALDVIGKTPVKLEGPSGTFTAKPES
ncbi:heavy-metal-associated domain-containing protein [Planctomicrobium piriforme]|uniref:Heavy-metal-associated domain-containing protein n=1 Tax=Planctomicrobium piriforme TaxID=1576369 RepID=A0A1I3RBT3_9PLAN|nr:heavy-metal-associated domain-containing protein [Planctomicrobium piriforme]SFJ43262.1 Heavy-metal-associated domain-containing protein [Planctomicrobium piriforme]